MAASSCRFSASMRASSDSPSAGTAGGGAGTAAAAAPGAAPAPAARCRCRPSANLESLRWVASGKAPGPAGTFAGAAGGRGGAAAVGARSCTAPTMSRRAICMTASRPSACCCCCCWDAAWLCSWWPVHPGPCSAHECWLLGAAAWAAGGAAAAAAGRRDTRVTLAAGLESPCAVLAANCSCGTGEAGNGDACGGARALAMRPAAATRKRWALRRTCMRRSSSSSSAASCCRRCILQWSTWCLESCSGAVGGTKMVRRVSGCSRGVHPMLDGGAGRGGAPRRPPASLGPLLPVGFLMFACRERDNSCPLLKRRCD